MPRQLSLEKLVYVKDGPMNLLLKLVKIRSLTAEIFLIWKNVARTNIAWTNVTMTVRISSRLSQ